MTPINFPQANFELAPPPEMPECVELKAYREPGLILSCWQMSWRERFSALFFGKAWLHVAANYHPPVAVIVQKTQFAKDKR